MVKLFLKSLTPLLLIMLAVSNPCFCFNSMKLFLFSIYLNILYTSSINYQLIRKSAPSQYHVRLTLETVQKAQHYQQVDIISSTGCMWFYHHHLQIHTFSTNTTHWHNQFKRSVSKKDLLYYLNVIKLNRAFLFLF